MNDLSQAVMGGIRAANRGAAWLCGQYGSVDPSMLRVHNMYSYPRRAERPNVGLALALLWCLAIWLAVSYLLGTTL